MALRAGRVGVSPEIVDNNGFIKGMSCNTYTKTEIDQKMSGKANSSDVYTKSQVDTLLDGKADKSDTYTKDATNNILLDLLPDLFDTPPNVEASGNPLVLTDSAGGTAGCVVTFAPIQSGSGTPSPQNVRPISGLTEVDVTVADAETNPTQTHTYTVDLDGTRYGGTVDFKTGAMSVTHLIAIYDGSEDESWSMYGTGSASAYAVIGRLPSVAEFTPNVLGVLTASYLENVSAQATWGNYDYFISQSNAMTGIDFVMGLKNISTSVNALKIYLAEHPLTICYKLATPTIVQLTPDEVSVLAGYNVLTTNGSSIALSYPVDVASYIRRKLNMPVSTTRALAKSSASEEIQEEVKEVSDLTPLEEVVEIKTVEPVETTTVKKTTKRTSTKK